jgi:hypothetical protein
MDAILRKGAFFDKNGCEDGDPHQELLHGQARETSPSTQINRVSMAQFVA